MFATLKDQDNNPISVFFDFLCERRDIAQMLSFFKPVATQHELIRVGGDGDGGYLLPNDLEGIKACFSPGVCENSSFEYEIAEKLGIPCFLADKSVEGPKIPHPLFNFERKHVGSRPLPGFMRLTDWVDQKSSLYEDGDLMLQMDIEGYEHEVIIDTDPSVFNKFRVIVLELHDVELIFGKRSLFIYRSLFEKLTRNHYVVHLHPNNCLPAYTTGDLSVPSLMEITLLRKDRCQLTGAPLQFPHPLDQDNVSDRASLPLPPCWYQPLFDETP